MISPLPLRLAERAGAIHVSSVKPWLTPVTHTFARRQPNARRGTLGSRGSIRCFRAVDEAESKVVVITTYFIPVKSGVEFWRSLTSNGVRVIIITNSLATNNHVPVHRAYARYRHDMVRAYRSVYEWVRKIIY